MTNGVSSTGHDSVGRVGGLRRPRFISAALAVLMMAAPLAVTTLVASSARAAGTEALYAFGDNTDGALGNGTTTDAYVPTVVTLPGGVTPTGGAAGGDHSLVIGSNGLLYAWGLGTDGQLGNGTTTTSSTPVQVSLPLGVVPVAVAAGDDHSLALGSNGTLYAWGYNGYGQLGNGTKTNEDTPVTVTFPSGVTATAIAAGENFSLALGSDGNVYAWGDGNLGALGQGNQSVVDHPAESPLAVGSHRQRHRGGWSIRYGHRIRRQPLQLGRRRHGPARERHHHVLLNSRGRGDALGGHRQRHQRRR